MVAIKRKGSPIAEDQPRLDNGLFAPMEGQNLATPIGVSLPVEIADYVRAKGKERSAWMRKAIVEAAKVEMEGDIPVNDRIFRMAKESGQFSAQRLWNLKQLLKDVPSDPAPSTPSITTKRSKKNG